MKFKAILIIVLSVFSVQNFSAQTVTTSLDATVRDITDLDIGFNRRSDKGNWWSDTSFKGLVAEMNPDVARYPGGTQANYWDWRTGQFLDGTDKTWNNKEVVKIPKFVGNLPAQTKIVYVVNMARPTPITGVAIDADEETLKSDATLNKKITDMIAAINQFKDAGKMPYAVELGNEFYFGNEEGGIFHIEEISGKFYAGWDEANSKPYESDDKKAATIKNVEFYIAQCKEIVSQLKAAFPTLKFAITTTKGGNGNSTRERWNNTVFSELDKNKYATLKSSIHAVTQHHYLNDKYGVQEKITDNATAKVAIAEGIEYPTDKIADYNIVPNNFKIWYTEYGEVKEIAEETWASAVRYGAFVYGWISLGDKVGQLDWHYISDNNVVKVGSPYKLAPVGIAAKLVSQAFSEMTEMQQINFTNNTTSVGNVKSLYGYKFKNDEKETILIINTNSIDFSTVDINNLFSFTGDQEMTQYYSNEPYVSGVAQGDNNIKEINEVVSGTVAIKKFSIAVIKVETPGLSVKNHLEKTFTIYPNPASNEVYIKTNEVIKQVSVWTISGKKVTNFKVINNSKINIENLNTGIYFLKIETDKGFNYKKFIKQ